MSRFWTGILLTLMAPALQAAIIAEQFTFALPSATSIYEAGHIFTISATYDNASTLMRQWNDGPNGKADFGANDDTVFFTHVLSTPSDSMAFYSGAVISVSGLLLPVGATPIDLFSINYSLAYGPLASVTDADFVLQLRADDIYIGIEFFGPDIVHPYAGKLLFQLEHFYVDSNRNLSAIQFTQFLPASSVQRAAIAQVPEPATLALLGLGVLGLAASRRRKW